MENTCTCVVRLFDQLCWKWLAAMDVFASSIVDCRNNSLAFFKRCRALFVNYQGSPFRHCFRESGWISQEEIERYHKVKSGLAKISCVDIALCFCRELDERSERLMEFSSGEAVETVLFLQVRKDPRHFL